MGKPRGSDHQSRSDEEHIDGGFFPCRISAKPEFYGQLVEFVEKIGVGPVGKRTAEPQLRDGVSRHLHGYENGGDQKSENENTILRHLGVGDSFHASKNSIKEHNGHPDQNTGGDFDFQKTGKNDAHAPHLAQPRR